MQYIDSLTEKAGFCGCGNPEAAMEFLTKLLAMHPLYENGGIDAVKSMLGGNEGAAWLMLYMLDNLGLTEHGGSVSGAWLTDDGISLLADLRDYSAGR